MGETLDYIVDKYGLELNKNKWTNIPGVDRIDLAKLFAELGFSHGAEIGVEKGSNAIVLCHNIPNLKLYCVDPWRLYRGGGRLQANYIQQRYLTNLKQTLADFDVIFIEKLSMEAVSDIPENYLDFVYIDANHRFDYV